jgi:hypothetical protein
MALKISQNRWGQNDNRPDRVGPASTLYILNIFSIYILKISNDDSLIGDVSRAQNEEGMHTVCHRITLDAFLEHKIYFNYKKISTVQVRVYRGSIKIVNLNLQHLQHLHLNICLAKSSI